MIVLSVKKDFPEAYEAYIELFPESLKEIKSKPNSCDSIESIRATLTSTK